MKRLFSKSLAFLCIAALSCGLFSVGVSAAVTEGTDFEVIQTFETAEEQEQAGPSNANSGVPDEVKIVTGEEALSGESSMSISHKDANWSFDFLMKEAPAPTISEANGIFFRFKTNAAKGAFWYLNDGPETDGDWSHNVGAFHFVSDEGKVTLNAATGSLPEDNFSGYVFIDIKDRMGNIDLTPIRLMFNAWSGVNWMGKSSYIDNVGYYKVENAGDTTQYQALTEAIEAAYPPPPPGLYLSYEDDPTPAESATGRYGLKPKLTAHVSGQLNDKTVLWSIQEGDAVIESADEERPLYSQEGPITVADATQIQYTGANFIDDCWSSWTVDGTRYWMHSDDWGNQTQKFIGTVDHPVQEKVFNKTREELFTNNDEINGQPWITNIYKDGYGGLLAFLHLEHAGENNQKGRVGLAYSTDNGDTFTFLGEIVVPHASRDTNADEGGGNIQGCPYIVKDNYIYVYFNEINTCVARADLTEVINAAREGTVCKWYKGLDATNTGNWTWTEPGIGGDCSPIGIPGGANVAGICHTQAAYSTFDNKYYLKARNNQRVRFYIMWANHDVGTLWNKSLSSDVDAQIWKGGQDRGEFERICHRLIERYFPLPNYYTIDGKPVFMIYEPDTLVRGLGGIEATRDALAWLREQVEKAGIPGLHLQFAYRKNLEKNITGVMGDNHGTGWDTIERLGFDSATNYQFCHLTDIDRDYLEILEDIRKNYAQMSAMGRPLYFPHVSLGWDNNPRYHAFRPGITRNNTPENVEKALRMAKDYLDAHPGQPPLVTINSWNEWTECSYLQPDNLYGYGYLEAVKRVFLEANEDWRAQVSVTLPIAKEPVPLP